MSKHEFGGIGKASAALTFALMAASPLVWLTQGIPGQITFWLLTKLYSRLASLGLVLINVGVANVQTLDQKAGFDGSMDEAFKLINEKGERLTPEEKAAIDDKVIAAFRKFAVFGKLRGS